MRLLSVLILLNTLLFSFNYKISNDAVAHGKTSFLEFTKEDGIQYKSISLGNRTFNVYSHPIDENKMYALLPINYYAKPKKERLTISYKKNGYSKDKLLDIEVIDGDYKKEKIQVQKSKVNPKGKEVNKRINKEYHEAMKIYGTSTNKNYLSTPFILPMESFITSDFGKARVYNDELKGYHSGTDFRAKVGTPIKASNDGVVVLVKDRFYSGGTVIIDHGRGIYTCYYHMSDFSVSENQTIQKGDVIGLSGSTGRVTGPHLHFSVRVSGVQVDPLQFIELMNENIFMKETI